MVLSDGFLRINSKAWKPRGAALEVCPIVEGRLHSAARKIVELANAHEPYIDGRILIERLNGTMLYQHKATPAEYKAGLNLAIERGWLELHESGTFVRFTQAGADLFA